VLMIGAILMHVKIGDPLKKSLPAFLMLVLSFSTCVTSL
jgi:cell shape-determining protein MreD